MGQELTKTLKYKSHKLGPVLPDKITKTVWRISNFDLTDGCENVLNMATELHKKST